MWRQPGNFTTKLKRRRWGQGPHSSEWADVFPRSCFFDGLQNLFPVPLPGWPLTSDGREIKDLRRQSSGGGGFGNGFAVLVSHVHNKRLVLVFSSTENPIPTTPPGRDRILPLRIGASLPVFLRPPRLWFAWVGIFTSPLTLS